MKIEIKFVQLESGEYRACCPALPGCSVVGLTREEATEKIQIAVSGYIASMDVALPRELERLARTG